MSTDRQRGWRVGHQGRDQMYYEELHGGSWKRLEVQGEMLLGPAHHVIYFASPTEWQRYPAWAQNRRDEIIARIMSAFPAPDYEYHGVGGGAASPPSVAVREPRPPRPPAKVASASGKERQALLIAIVLVLAISGGMCWLVVSGLTSGDTFWPSTRRSVALSAEPGMYWTAIVVYSAIGLGTLGLGLWGIREGRKLRP